LIAWPALCRLHPGTFQVRALGNEFKVLAGPEINIMLATWEPVVRDFGGKKTITMLAGPDHARIHRLMVEPVET
jgi:hypothetical protein